MGGLEKRGDRVERRRDVLKVRKSSDLFVFFFCYGEDGNRRTKSFSGCALGLDVLFTHASWLDANHEGREFLILSTAQFSSCPA